MRSILPKNLIRLAKNCPVPLYAVGGSVRDFLAGLTPANGKRDFDICAPLPAERFVDIAQKCDFQVIAVYKNTGTVKLKDNQGAEYEFSSFRSDKYVRGVHTPVEILFTDDILLDARRRDFTANAVYYHLQKDEFVDPLQGIPAIREKRLTTVAPAQKVFGEDGLRLMRLARQAAELGFTPDTDCFCGAKANAALIADISPERIFTELTAILRADCRFGVKNGQYRGLCLLDETGVLDYILPELTQGRGMAQRADFHNYDVLQHSLRAAIYAEPSVRLAALLHDVGKPFCMLEQGNSHAHHTEGERLVKQILTRLKAPNKTIERTAALVAWHMYDFDGKTSENKLRRFFVKNYPLLDELLALKQADFSACKDELTPAPTCVKWKSLLAKMQDERVPFSLKQLAVAGKDLLALGLPAQKLSLILEQLLMHVAVQPADNTKSRLLKLALSFSKNLQ